MSGLTGIFDIGKLSLLASQRALQVVSQNLANANTPGYSRQEVVLEQTAPSGANGFQTGTGVTIAQVRRLVNSFLESQITVSQQDLGWLQAQADSYVRLEGIFSDSNDQGISKQLSEFFNALRNVAGNPQGQTERTVLLAQATALTSQFNQTAADLIQARKDLNTQVLQTITEVNTLAAQVAVLNGKVAAAETSGQAANDLRDQRGQLLNELAKRIDIHTFEDPSGQVQVFVGRGNILVERAGTIPLAGTPSADNSGFLSVTHRGADITSLIGGGSLGGLLTLRDGTIPDIQDRLDTLAASLINEVNQVHASGYALDGTTGNALFAPLTVNASAPSANTGAATVGSGAITANSLLTTHDYEIRFSSATAYSIVNATTGATIKGNYTGTAITAPSAGAPLNIVTGTNDTLAVTVDGTASGVITLTGTASPGQAYSSGADLATEIQAKINADAALVATGKSVTVVYGTTTTRFVITSNSTASTSAVNVTGGNARAALGLAAGTGTAASGTYGSPQTFNLDGISVAVSGTVAADDVFTVNARAGAAEHIAVALTDARKVAASATQAGLPGDNSTALALIALQSTAVSTLNGATLNGYYAATAAAVGSAAQANTQDLSAQEVVRNQLDSQRGETSGVSIDEELTNMIQFQRAYQAAAKLIVTADELFQVLLDIKR